MGVITAPKVTPQIDEEKEEEKTEREAQELAKTAGAEIVAEEPVPTS